MHLAFSLISSQPVVCVWCVVQEDRNKGSKWQEELSSPLTLSVFTKPLNHYTVISGLQQRAYHSKLGLSSGSGSNRGRGG